MKTNYTNQFQREMQDDGGDLNCAERISMVLQSRESYAQHKAKSFVQWAYKNGWCYVQHNDTWVSDDDIKTADQLYTLFTTQNKEK